MGCGCGRRVKQLAAYNEGIANMFKQNENFVQVELLGGGTNVRHVPAPTRALLDYNVRSYGSHRPGAILYVHKNDLAARPDLFRAVDDPQTAITSLEDLSLSDEIIRQLNDMDIDTLQALALANVDDLIAVKGIGQATAARIVSAAQGAVEVVE